MGICSCTSTGNPEGIYSEFFSNILIRKKPQKDVCDFIKVKKSGENKVKVSDKRWLMIVDILLTNNKEKEISVKLWTKVLSMIREKDCENIFFLTLPLLAQNDLKGFLEYFSELVTFFNMDDLVFQEKKIKKDFLIKFLTLYLNVITKEPAEFLKDLGSSPGEFENACNEAFSESQIDNLIKKLLIDYKDDLIDYAEFFELKYNILINDDSLRKELFESIKNKA